MLDNNGIPIPEPQPVVFVANPHALLVDNVVTEVVYMQNYSQEEIEQVLTNYTFDEVIRCEDYGHYLVVGDIRDTVFPEFIGPPKPFPSWVPNPRINNWKAPVDLPPNNGKILEWNEETLSWIATQDLPEEMLDLVNPDCPGCPKPIKRL